jgi:hypothetical protein
MTLRQLCDPRSAACSNGDDAHMPFPRRLPTAVSGSVCLTGALVMAVASFLPYSGGNWGDGLLTGNEVQSLTTMSVISGSDAWFVLGTILTLGVAAAYHLKGSQRRATGFVALAASLVSVGLAIKLPGTWLQDGVTYGEPYLLFAGFYVFFGGAVTAVGGALLMVAMASLKGHPARVETSGGEPHARTYQGSG